jgi:hypothetical protein
MVASKPGDEIAEGVMRGGQFCPQPPFRRFFRDVSEPSRGKGRLKAGCSQDWLPHNLGGMVSKIKQHVALGWQHCAAAGCLRYPHAFDESLAHCRPAPQY